MKKIYLIGKDINYSKSPFLQNSLLKKLGYDDVEYEIKNLERDELEDFIEEIRNNDGILGANVTIPYKKIIGEKYTELREPVNIIYKDCERKKIIKSLFLGMVVLQNRFR